MQLHDADKYQCTNYFYVKAKLMIQEGVHSLERTA